MAKKTTKKNYRLIELRGDRTQDEVATAVGVDRSTYAHIENGTGFPSLALALRLARYFGVPAESLFPSEDVAVHHPQLIKKEA